MAASPTVSSLKVRPGNSAVPLSLHASPVVRTPLHALETGFGSRSARRQITPAGGFALEVLGHAIEYLADEYSVESGSGVVMTARDSRVEAMQVLMAANREVYYSCPVMPSLGERLRRRLLPWA